LKKAEDLGEFKIIQILWENLTKAPNMVVPFGDDVSAFKIENNTVIIKTDMLVGRTDVPPTMTRWQAARKAVVMNISDLAAKGVKPSGILVSLGIPPYLTEDEIVQIGKGLDAGANEYSTHILGGDTNETQDLIISVSAFGVAGRGGILLRNGASPGEIVATTGPFGLTACGLKALKEKLKAPEEIMRKIVDAVLIPRARLKEGLTLTQSGGVTSSIDSSDGLARSLYEISRVSRVGFVIDKMPVSKEASEFARIHDLNPLDLSLYGGEEYELIVTVKPELWSRVDEAVRREGGRLLKIGRTIAGEGIFLKRGDEMLEIESGGYEHFKGN